MLVMFLPGHGLFARPWPRADAATSSGRPATASNPRPGKATLAAVPASRLAIPTDGVAVRGSDMNIHGGRQFPVIWDEA